MLDDFEYMKCAYRVAYEDSDDPRTQTGAVIVSGGNIIALESNRIANGLGFSPEMIERENKGYYINHAERRAIAECAKKGLSTKGGTMYTFWEPCTPCGLMIIDSGIEEVVLHKELNDYYRDNMDDDKWLKDQDMALKNMKDAGINVRYLEGKLFNDNFSINFRGKKFSP